MRTVTAAAISTYAALARAYLGFAIFCAAPVTNAAPCITSNGSAKDYPPFPPGARESGSDGNKQRRSYTDATGGGDFQQGPAFGNIAGSGFWSSVSNHREVSTSASRST